MDDAREVLQSAIERVHEIDDHLAGMRPARWMLIAESEDADGRTVTVSHSDDLAPWETLGLLRFATLQEEARLYGDEVDHEAH